MRRPLLLLVGAAAALWPATASAAMPWPQPGPGQDPYAYQAYLHSSTPPNDFDPNDWKLTSRVDPAVPPTAQELGGVMGPSVDRAWSLSTGRPDVRIAVLDSGIMWNDAGAMRDLRDKVYINWSELPPPEYTDSGGVHTACAGTTLPPRRANTPFPTCYDVNHDGVFNVDDYATDPRVTAPAHTLFLPGVLTPEDLIEVFSCYDAAAGTVGSVLPGGPADPRRCSNGAENTDNDGDGFAHDIAGWNFMERTNDPYDEPHYGHGTGEARDSNAEADNGGSVGTCPSCMVMPLKVGDSFIADVNDFAQAVLFATDQGASVVQEALGTLNHSSLGQVAIDYAHRHGVVVVASAADEEAGHHNWPSNYNYTLVVNSLRSAEAANSAPSGPTPQPGRSYLVLNGCTNYGGHIVVSVPSGSCSSEATGKSAGMVGLLESAARNQVALGLLQPYAPGIALSADEAKQIVAGTADDVDLEDPASPYPPDRCEATPPSYPPGPPANFGSLEGGERFHSIAGWDQYFGYGRVNAYCMLRAVVDGRIPPEAELTSPAWFSNLDTGRAGSFDVQGRVAAVRAQSYHYTLEIAYGVQPHDGDWQTVYTSPTLTAPLDGHLATLSAGQVQAALAAYNPATYGHAVDPNGDQTDWLAPPYTNASTPGRNEWDRYTVSIRLRVTDDRGLRGEDRRTLQSHGDEASGAQGAMAPGFPLDLGSDGASSPVAADLRGDNRNALVFGTSDGQVHALDARGRELPGWPQAVSPLAYHTGEPAFGDPEVRAAAARVHSAVLGSVAVGDLDRSGRLEVVAADMSGWLNVWEADGSERPGFPVHVTWAYSAQGVPPAFNRDPDNRVQAGFIASPTLADLDHSGRLSIVIGALDRHLYAWNADGSPRRGFPVLLASPEKVQSVDPVTQRVHLVDGSGADNGTKIVDTAAVGDLLGDGHQEIVVGRNEEYAADRDGGFNASADSFPLTPILQQVGQAVSLVTPGNSRVYAVFADGYCHGQATCAALPPDAVPANAYVPGWPAKVGLLDLSLLPEVGTGIDSGPALVSMTCPVSDRPGLKVGVFAADGPAYLLQSDGSSCYGTGPGADGQPHARALESTVSLGDMTDTPFLAAFGLGAIGDLAPAGSGVHDLVMATAVAGATKSVDAAVDDHQLHAENGVAVWDLATGRMHPGFPHHLNDLQFLTGPAIADLTGTGLQDVIEASATSDLRAVDPSGQEVAGFVKNTGDWTIATPLVAALGDASTLSLASVTRSGTLSVFGSSAGACSGASWPRYHHDAWNSGDAGWATQRPATITDLGVQVGVDGLSLSFTAPHGAGACGNAAGYEVRVLPCPATYTGLAAQTPTTFAAHPAGTAETLHVAAPGGPALLAVSAVNDDARAGGDIGAPALVPVAGAGAGCLPGGLHVAALQTLPTTGAALADTAAASGGAVLAGAALAAVRRRRRRA